MQAQKATPETTRRGDRISLSVSLQISCTDQTGKRFSEIVQTVNVSRNGCCIRLKQTLSAGQRIHLQRLGTGEEAIGRIVGQSGICTEGNLYGIEVLNPGEDFWGIRFPAQKELEEGSVRVLLKCAICQSCEATALNEVDLSVFQITHRLTRKCRNCNTNTVWETVPQPSDTAKAKSEVLEPGKRHEKRKHTRISMKTVACVGQTGPHADIVDVQNVSRGGICFHSSRTYEVDTWVQVAVPYTPGAANIFVAGRVVRFRKLSNGLIEYGVEYVRS